MPMAFLAVVLMPFGLEALPLTAMGWGLDWVVLVAGKTAAWSAGVGGVAAMPLLAMGLIAGGFLWLALWRERWRLAGLAPILLALPIALAAPHPDVLIDEAGATVAVRGPTGGWRSSTARARVSWSRTGCAPTATRGWRTRPT